MIPPDVRLFLSVVAVALVVTHLIRVHFALWLVDRLALDTRARFMDFDQACRFHAHRSFILRLGYRLPSLLFWLLFPDHAIWMIQLELERLLEERDAS